MIKLQIAGIPVQQYTVSYSCQASPVEGNNGFYDVNGNYITDSKGDEIRLDVSLEGVPDETAQELSTALMAESVEIDYTNPLPQSGKFRKISYTAECDDPDPDNYDYDDTSGIEWNIRLSLRSAGLVTQQSGL